MASSDRQLVTFRGGFIADFAVVSRLLAIEARGARFEPADGGRFQVVPPSVLTADDVAFLRAHRDEARAVVTYQADDAHLFSDKARTLTGKEPLIYSSPSSGSSVAHGGSHEPPNEISSRPCRQGFGQ